MQCSRLEPDDGVLLVVPLGVLTDDFAIVFGLVQRRVATLIELAPDILESKWPTYHLIVVGVYFAIRQLQKWVYEERFGVVFVCHVSSMIDDVEQFVSQSSSILWTRLRLGLRRWRVCRSGCRAS